MCIWKCVGLCKTKMSFCTVTDVDRNVFSISDYDYLTGSLSFSQSVLICCWLIMRPWRWRMLRDGVPLQRPLATETDRWVSIWNRQDSETHLWSPATGSLWLHNISQPAHLRWLYITVALFFFPVWKPQWDREKSWFKSAKVSAHSSKLLPCCKAIIVACFFCSSERGYIPQSSLSVCSDEKRFIWRFSHPS